MRGPFQAQAPVVPGESTGSPVRGATRSAAARTTPRGSGWRHRGSGPGLGLHSALLDAPDAP